MRGINYIPASDRLSDGGEVTVGVVGCGRRFRTAIAPFLASTGVRVSFTVDPSPTALRELRFSGSPIRTAPTLTPELLREAAPSLVVISSPSGLHFEQARIALGEKLPTYVEKPMARTTAQARELAAMGTHVRLAVSEQRRYRADLLLVRQLMGQLGEIRRIAYDDLIEPADSFVSSWRNDPRLAGGGIMFDLGYHTVSALYWLLPGESSELEVHRVFLRRGRFRVEDEARVRGAYGNIEVNLRVGLTGSQPREALRIDGEYGRVELLRLRGESPRSVVTSHSLKEKIMMAQVALDAAAETESLRRFLDDRTDSGHIGRHVRTVRFIEQVYLADGRG